MRKAFAWLGHPVTVAAVVVLLVNDHVLKAAYPGWVTGKLSDVAGLVVLPPVLSVLGLRRLPSVAVTGLGFTVVKVFPGIALLLSSWWGVVRADPTDLVALPALGLALWIGSTVETGTRRWEKFGVYVALPASVFAIAATTGPGSPYPMTFTVSWNNLLVAGDVGPELAEDQLLPMYIRGELHYPLRVSSDGLDWREIRPDEESAFLLDYRRLNLHPEQDCVPGEPRHCFRIVHGRLKVEETTDGGATWITAWEVAEWQRHLLAKDLLTEPEEVGARAIVVQPVAGGYVVVVATDTDGFARRDVSGAWQRIGRGSGGVVQPLRSSPYHGPFTSIALVLGLFFAAAAIAVAAFPSRRVRPARSLVPTFLLPVAAVGALCAARPDYLFDEMAIAVWVVLPLSLVVGLVALTILPRHAWPGVLAVVSAEVVGWPIVQILDDTGELTPGEAVGLRVALVVVGLVLAGVIGYHRAPVHVDQEV